MCRKRPPVDGRASARSQHNKRCRPGKRLKKGSCPQGCLRHRAAALPKGTTSPLLRGAPRRYGRAPHFVGSPPWPPPNGLLRPHCAPPPGGLPIPACKQCRGAAQGRRPPEAGGAAPGGPGGRRPRRWGPFSPPSGGHLCLRQWNDKRLLDHRERRQYDSFEINGLAGYPRKHCFRGCGNKLFRGSAKKVRFGAIFGA